MEAEEYARIDRHETAHFWYRGVHALFVGALKREAIRQGRPLRLLDAGCGTGGLLASIGAALPDTTRAGFDLSPLALGFAKAKADAKSETRLAQGSIEQVPFAAGSFDAVVSADVLYHAAVTDDAAALRELARVVRPGGLVLLNLPAHRELRGAHDAVIHTARRYEREDLQRIAAAAGLEVERLTGFNALLDPIVRLLRRRSGPGSGKPPKSDVSLPPAAVNGLLSAWLRFEAWLALRIELPLGLSLFAELRKPSS